MWFMKKEWGRVGDDVMATAVLGSQSEYNDRSMILIVPENEKSLLLL